MMRGFKKICVLALCFVLAVPVALFTGCGKSNADITILLMANAEQDAFYKAHFEALAEELEVSIEYKGVAHQDYDAELKNKMNAEDIPDLFYIRPGEIKKLVKAGRIDSLDSYMSGADFTGNVDLSLFSQDAKNAFKYDSATDTVGSNADAAKTYGVNMGFSYQGLGYNKTFVKARENEIKAAGLPLPWELGVGTNPATYTFAQFKTILEICTTATGGGSTGTDKIYGMNVPTDIMPLMWSSGAEIIRSNTIFSQQSDSDEAVEILTWIKSCIDGGSINKDASWGEWSSKNLAFFTEIGSWEVAGYIDTYDIDFEMMPWPTKDGGEGWYGTIGSSAMALSTKCGNKDAAFKIASSFLYPATMDKMVRSGLSLPMTEFLAGAYIDSDNDEIYKPQSRGIFIDVINSTHGRLSPVNNSFSPEWLDDFMLSLDEVWNASKTPSAFVAAKKTTMQTYYNTQGT